MSDETVVVGGPSEGGGHRLGKYEIEDILGEGAMGVVYRARDPVLDRVVAIKTIRDSGFPAEALAELRTRFEREAKSAARLSHPGIVGVHDYGEADGVAYLVMEFVDGLSLKDVLAADARPTTDQAVRIGAEVLDALQYAHSHGVIHRDIKPANVMLTVDGRAKLTDFGIARFEAEGMTVTQTGQIIGTPSYMAPEQLQGEPATRSTDIYSAGALIYELVTGKKPYTGSTISILHRIVHEALIPPTTVNVSAPSWLDALLLKAMAKRPGERFATAGAFAEALRDGGKGNVDRKAGSKGRLALAVVVALVVAGSGGAAWVYRNALFRAGEPEAWVEAQTADTIAAYEIYLQGFPSGANAAAAEAQIARLERHAAESRGWLQAESADTIDALEEFLAAYPDGINATTARARLEALRRQEAERESWQQAEIISTAGAYREFLDGFPSSERAPIAEQRIVEFERRALEAAAWAQAQIAGTAEAYQAFVERFPESTNAATAADQIAGLERRTAELAAWTEAQSVDTAEAYWFFLDRFPDSPVAGQARARIVSMQAPGTAFPNCDVCPEMVVIPPGSFTMGSPQSEPGRDDEEGPQHRVTIGYSFAMGRYEVTFAEWDACFADGGCSALFRDRQGWGRGSRPVINVSWNDTQEYVSWLSVRTNSPCRLPSEAEWEYAARAGTETAYALPPPRGSDDIAGQDLARCYRCSSEGGAPLTAPIGSFPPNDWGLYDMHGNVSETVQDCWHDNYDNAPDDGRPWLSANDGDCGRRVTRGGSWHSDSRFSRAASRSWMGVDTRYGDYVGFRVVCDLSP